jgi:hypothetical protein
MINSKFAVLFLLLTKQDRNRFLAFLHSTFHNNSPRLLRLGEYFQAHKRPVKEDAFTYVYSAKRKYSDVLMRRLMNGLLEEL